MDNEVSNSASQMAEKMELERQAKFKTEIFHTLRENRKGGQGSFGESLRINHQLNKGRDVESISAEDRLGARMAGFLEGAQLLFLEMKNHGGKAGDALTVAKFAFDGISDGFKKAKAESKDEAGVLRETFNDLMGDFKKVLSGAKETFVNDVVKPLSFRK